MQSWEISGAKRGGQPVVALVWVPVIFNPKSAAVKGAEATPRLLSVGPVVTKERVGLAGQPPVVRMKLSLDATGAITRAEPEGEVKETVLASIRDGLKIWKFAPARVGGQAVGAAVGGRSPGGHRAGAAVGGSGCHAYLLEAGPAKGHRDDGISMALEDSLQFRVLTGQRRRRHC